MISAEARRPAFRWPTDLDEPQFFYSDRPDASDPCNQFVIFGVKWYLAGRQYGQAIKFPKALTIEQLMRLGNNYGSAVARFRDAFVGLELIYLPGILRTWAWKLTWRWAQWGQGCGVLT